MKSIKKYSRFFILLFSLSVIFSSCDDDLKQPALDTAYKEEILSYFKSQQDTAPEKIEEITVKFDFKNVETYEFNANRQILIASGKEELSSIQKPGESARIVIWRDYGLISKVNIIVFNKGFFHPDSYNDVTLSLINNTTKSLNGKYSVYNLYQSLLFFNEYKSNKLDVSARVKLKYTKTSSSGGKTEGCTDWYLVTTYSNGSQTWNYLYTTCDCGAYDRVAGTNCNTGGTSNTNGVINIPVNPSEGDRYAYTDGFGSYRLMEYRCNEGGCAWVTIYTQLPTYVVDANQTAFYWVPPSPAPNDEVISPDGLNYVYNASWSQWIGYLDDYIEINRRFGNQFVNKFRIPLDIPGLTDADYINQINQKLISMDVENTLLNDPDNRYPLRPIYYTISKGYPPTSTTTINVVTPNQWTIDPVYGNPGTITSTGNTIAIPLETESGTVISVVIYFQKTQIL